MARGRGRQGADVVVPRVVGHLVSDAREVAEAAQLVLTSDDADGPPLSTLTWSGTSVVTRQRPAPGELAQPGDLLWVRCREEPDDGSGGVREPRHPRPDPVAVAVDPADAGDDMKCGVGA
ncbi:MAG: hypothetical protein ABI181_13510 [Mycobacteriaceae bacterium]